MVGGGDEGGGEVGAGGVGGAAGAGMGIGQDAEAGWRCLATEADEWAAAGSGLALALQLQQELLLSRGHTMVEVLVYELCASGETKQAGQVEQAW